MGPVDSDKITRVSPYSGYHKEFVAFRLQGYHLLSLFFPKYSAILQIFDSVLMVLQPQSLDWFGLLRFRSPLLTEYDSLSFPLGTKMFQFPRYTFTWPMYSVKDDMIWLMPGFPIRRSTGQSLHPARRRLSQVVASFFVFLCQGIHCTPLIT